MRALGCHIPLYAESNIQGVRDVVVDVDVPQRRHRSALGLRASTAAVVRAGGQLVIDRPYALGCRSGRALRAARGRSAGTLRVVARVGMDQDFATFELDAWDATGKPLRTHVPVAGQKATVSDQAR